jgi:hypothetical protein
MEEVLMRLNGWFSAVLRFLLVELQSGWKWLVSSASIHFLCYILSLLQCHCSVIYFAYMRIWSSSPYIPTGMGMLWLEYVIAIIVNVEWNTFVESVTIRYLAYFGTAAPKYGVFIVFRQTFY